MLSESLRRRLEELNRERLPAAPSKREPQPPPAPRKPLLPKAELLESAVVCENRGGEHLVIPLPVDDLWRGGEGLVADRLAHLKTLTNFSSRPSPHRELGAPHLAVGAKTYAERGAEDAKLADGFAPLIDAMPQRFAMLDLETCGLSGSGLFLVGLLRTVDDRLTIELLFARSYAEERAVMESLWDRLTGCLGPGCDAIGTFNGKSFDWPMVMDRSRRHLMHKNRELRAPHHVDVLHAARRKWKGRLPDCKLQTIERLVCRRTRTGDIPGNQIPAAYDAYVRTGRPHEMEAVLYHNALDLVTLLDIAMRVAA